MRVECVRLLRPGDGVPIDYHGGLHTGRAYLVLQMLAERSGGLSLRILAHDGQQSSFWDSRCFRTVDRRIPSSWVCQVDDDGVMTMSPARWLEPGFWVDYYDDEPDALRIFDEELFAMTKELHP